MPIINLNKSFSECTLRTSLVALPHRIYVFAQVLHSAMYIVHTILFFSYCPQCEIHDVLKQVFFTHVSNNDQNIVFFISKLVHRSSLSSLRRTNKALRKSYICRMFRFVESRKAFNFIQIFRRKEERSSGQEHDSKKRMN